MTTEEELEAIQASKDRLFNQLFTFAKKYLDDGNWRKRREGTEWVRKVEGKLATYRVATDTVYMHGRWRRNAAAFLHAAIQEHGSLGDIKIAPDEEMASYEQALKNGEATLVITPMDPETKLTSKEKEDAKRVPPDQTILATMFGYDNDNQRLFRVVGDQIEYVTPDLFIPIMGKRYAMWRVVSMLLFNNPYGVADHEKHREILGSALDVETPPVQVSKAMQTFRYRLRPPKPAIATKEEARERGRVRPYPTYTPAQEIRERRDAWVHDRAADMQRVAEIKAERHVEKMAIEATVDSAVRAAEEQGMTIDEQKLRRRLRRASKYRSGQ